MSAAKIFAALFLSILGLLVFAASQLSNHPSNIRARDTSSYLVPVNGWTVNAEEGAGDWYNDEDTDDKYIELFPNHPDFGKSKEQLHKERAAAAQKVAHRPNLKLINNL